jgi:hypothetical protein
MKYFLESSRFSKVLRVVMEVDLNLMLKARNHQVLMRSGVLIISSTVKRVNLLGVLLINLVEIMSRLV